MLKISSYLCPNLEKFGDKIKLRNGLTSFYTNIDMFSVSIDYCLGDDCET